jgi:hypothetical protein
VKGISDVTF